MRDHANTIQKPKSSQVKKNVKIKNIIIEENREKKIKQMMVWFLVVGFF